MCLYWKWKLCCPCIGDIGNRQLKYNIIESCSCIMYDHQEEMARHASSINNSKRPECFVALSLPVTMSTHATEINECNSVDLNDHSCEKPLPGVVVKDAVKNQMCDYGLKYNHTLMDNIIQEQQSKYIIPFMCPTCKRSFIEEEQFLNHGAVCLKSYVFLNTSADTSNLSNSYVEKSKDPFETSYVLNVSSPDGSRYSKECFVKLARLSVNLKPTDVVKLCPFNKSSKTYNSIRDIACSKLLKNYGYVESEESFGCVLCSYKCQKFFNLKHHMLVHSNEKLFPCHLCECKFKYSSGLASHLSAKHTSTTTPICSTKRFKCLSCDKRFAKKWNLVKHVNSCSKDDTSKDIIACSNLTTLHDADSEEYMKIDEHFGETLTYESEMQTNKEVHASSLFDKSKQLNMNNKMKQIILVKEEPVDVYETSDCSAEYTVDACVKHEIAEVAVDYIKLEIENLYSIDYSDNKMSNNKASPSNSNENVSLGTDAITTALDKNSYTCNKCNKGFSKSASLKRHLVTHSGEKLFKCHLCEKRYTVKESLLYHLKSHTGDKPFKCNECGKAFIKQLQLKYHLWHRHNRSIDNSGDQDESFYFCQVCTKRCVTPLHLKRHMQSHEKPHKCHLCEHSFSLKGNLKRHLVTHTGEFKCDKCDYASKTSTELKSHCLRKHSSNSSVITGQEIIVAKQQSKEEIPCQAINNLHTIKNITTAMATKNDEEMQPTYSLDYKHSAGVNKTTNGYSTMAKNSHECTKCKKAFSMAYLLRRHLKTHSDEKPYECNFCHNRYKHKHYLNDHIKSHNLEYLDESYFCTVCSKRCVTPLHLKRHMQSHEEPHKCHLCGASFQKGSLKRHLLIHTGERSFKCNNCDYSANRSTDLKRHCLRKHHSDNSSVITDQEMIVVGVQPKEEIPYQTVNTEIVLATEHDEEFQQTHNLECKQTTGVNETTNDYASHTLTSAEPITGTKIIVNLNLKECDDGYGEIKNTAAQHKQIGVGEHEFQDFYGNFCKLEIIDEKPEQTGKEGIESVDVYTNVYNLESNTIDVHELKMVIETDKEVNDLHKMNVSLGSDTITTATPTKNSCMRKKYKEDFAKAYLLKGHLKIHSDEKPFECQLCQNRYKGKRYFNHHIKSHNLENQDESYYCKVCTKRCITLLQLKSHMRCHEEKKYKCHLCEWSFSTRGNLKRHLVSHTGEKPFTCHLCEKKYTVKESLVYHLKSHIGDKPFKCSDCSKAFIRQLHLKYHMWNVHNRSIDNSDNQNESSYYCKVCRKQCVTPVHLKMHMRSHEKKYKCHLCEQSFPTRGNFKRHLATHTQHSREGSFKCHLCEKNFTAKSSLLYHIMAHSGEKPFKCSECSKGFIRQLQLKYHLWNVHNRSIDSSNQNEASCYCQVCTKECVTSIHLKMHMRSHENKYKCHLCERSFPARPNLKRHLVSHSGQKSFKCHLCEKWYTTKYSLLYHMKSHTGSKPLKSNKCDYATARSYDLKKHCLRKHGSNSSVITFATTTSKDLKKHCMRKDHSNSLVNTDQAMVVVDEQSKDEIPCQTNKNVHTIKNIEPENDEKVEQTYKFDYEESVGVSKTTNVSYSTTLHTLPNAEAITDTVSIVNLNDKECGDVHGCCGKINDEAAELKQKDVEEHGFEDTCGNFCKIENNPVEFDVDTNFCKTEVLMNEKLL